MENRCEYCKNVFESYRKDKRYCSNSCKQLAYMVRVGQGLGTTGTLKSENVKPSRSQNVNMSMRENVKPMGGQNVNTSTHQNVKPMVGQNVNTVDRQSVKTDPLPFDRDALLKDLKGFIKETVNDSIETAMEKVKAPKSQNVNLPNDEAVKSSTNQNVMPMETGEPVILDLEEESEYVEEEGYMEKEEDPEEEEDDISESSSQNIKPSRGQNVKMGANQYVKASKSQNVMAAVELSEEPEKTEAPALIKEIAKEKQPEQTTPKKISKPKAEKQYEPYFCEFLNDIYDHFHLLSRDLLFLEKEKSFPGRCKQVGWVSVRYRSLLENVLTLSEMNRVNLSDLVDVTNAFTLLIRSKSYEELPGNYPYTDQIKSLRDKLKAFCLEYKDEESIPFRIAPTLRKDLLLYRMELAQSFPKKPFCKLEFNDDKR